jgi:hypothetical protein
MANSPQTGNLSRRDLIKRGLIGAAGLMFFDPFGHWTVSAALPPAGAPKVQGRAKSIIQIWMWGGPCHLDTFDPKPGAGRDYCGPLTKPIETNVSGIRICELLPLLAKQADKYSIIRSMTHGSFAHETASYITQTGFDPGDRISHPCAGAVVSLFKGYDHGYKGLIPPYIVLTSPLGRFSESGLLGSQYKPFATGGDPGQPRFAVEGITVEGLSDQRQQARRQLLGSLDTLGQAMPHAPQFEQFKQCAEEADATVAETGKLYDLSAENDAMRDRYGRNTFGQSCLMARRLVERGVPFVSINYRGWDTHKQHFELMRRNLPEMDKGMATLLQDLSERGLLDSTIVWWGGEFGRTPKVMWEAPWNGGRGHFGSCFNSVVAGGGFKGGHVVGASDDKGMEVAERPVHPRDLLGSMYELLGIDADGPLPNNKGIEVSVLPPAKANAEQRRLYEIM